MSAPRSLPQLLSIFYSQERLWIEALTQARSLSNMETAIEKSTLMFKAIEGLIEDKHFEEAESWIVQVAHTPIRHVLNQSLFKARTLHAFPHFNNAPLSSVFQSVRANLSALQAMLAPHSQEWELARIGLEELLKEEGVPPKQIIIPTEDLLLTIAQRIDVLFQPLSAEEKEHFTQIRLQCGNRVTSVPPRSGPGVETLPVEEKIAPLSHLSTS